MKGYNDKMIKDLLKKFYDGTSTADEERAIAEYFRSCNEIPTHLRADYELFRRIDAANNSLDEIPIPNGLEDRLSNFIDSLDLVEPVESIESVKSIEKAAIGRRSPRIYISAIAACAAILVGAFFALQQPSSTDIEPVVAQNPNLVTIDTIKRTAKVDNHAIAEAEPSKASTPSTTPQPRAVTKNTKVSKKAKPATTQAAKTPTTIEIVATPTAPDEAILAAEAAMMKLAAKLEKTNTELDIAESKIALIPELLN